MDEKALYKMLGEDSYTADKQVRTLHTSMADLLATLGGIIPDAAPAFQELSASLNNSMDELLQARDNVWAYFTGRGTVAQAIRRHVGLQCWVDSHLYGNSQHAGAETTPSEVQSFLLEKLQKFDFHPSQEPDDVNVVNGFLNEIVMRVRTDLFTTPYPPLPAEGLEMSAFQTGLYGCDGDGQNLTIILRTENTRLPGVKSIFMVAPGNQPILWHYHPYEDVWLNSRFGLTFEGLLEGLELEFTKAVDAASADIGEMDFQQELIELERQSNAIFDAEQHLPASFRLPGSPEEIFCNEGEASFLNVRAADVTLTFLNTKGQYPQRSGAKLFTRLNDNLHTLSAESTPVTLQVALVQKAKRVFGVLNELIRSSATTTSAPAFAFRPLQYVLTQPTN